MSTPHIAEVAAGVYGVAVGKAILASNAYFVRSGPSWVLIDTAWANSGEVIRAAAESVFGPGTRPAATSRSGSATCAPPVAAS